ncbi:MAG: response regulator transcription factor [Magnetospirillum sp.]|nr:response regulator transcription factor [Magnetospirillum sp.]
MKIAIVDDHAIVRDGLKSFIDQLGSVAEVHEGASFADAVSVAGRLPELDLLVLDLHMPDMEALAGLKAVRAVYAGPIAVLSMSEDIKTITSVMAEGVSGYLPKRLGIPAIVSALKLVLAGEVFVPSSAFSFPGAPAAAKREETPGADGGLTQREREVLALLAEGLSNKGIARRLALSEVTIKTHLGNVFRKLGVENRVQAVRRWQGMF